MINGGLELNTDSKIIFLCYNYSLGLKWVLKSGQIYLMLIINNPLAKWENVRILCGISRLFILLIDQLPYLSYYIIGNYLMDVITLTINN